MFSEALNELIDAALADGELSDKERAVLHKRAAAEGVDPDELDIILDGRLAKMRKAAADQPAVQMPPVPPVPTAAPAPTPAPAPSSAPRTQRLGNVLTCPNCGAPVKSGSAVCSECGFAFTNVESNSSYTLLSQKLEAVDVAYRDKTSKFSLGTSPKTKEKVSIIKMFPVPNTRADLLEFLISLASLLNDEGMSDFDMMHMMDGEALESAYRTKYNECVEKAKLSFSNDPDFAPFLKKKGMSLFRNPFKH